jgi:hypothetical protein
VLGAAKRNLTITATNELPAMFPTADELVRTIHGRAVAKAEEAIKYYQEFKRPKRWWAVWLRVLALLATAIAAVLPIIAQMATSRGEPIVQPGWSAIALGAAGLFIGFDHFFGFSGAWMRFTLADLRLQRVLEQFHLDWQAEAARWSSTITAEQAQHAIAIVKAFMQQVTTIIEDETSAWVTEFQTSLKQLDESTKLPAPKQELGAISVTVSNGDQAAFWDLTIDGAAALRQQGKTAALSNLSPGLHTLSATGQINGQPKQAAIVVVVSAGNATATQLTLA